LAVRLPLRSNYISKGLSICRALGRSRISRAPFASLSLGSLGARLAARFVFLSVRVRLSAAGGWVGAAASRLRPILLRL